MTIKLKSRYIDWILITFASINAFLATLMGLDRIPSGYINLVLIGAGTGIVLEFLWRIFGNPSTQRKKALEIIKVALDQYCEEFSTNDIKVRANVMMAHREKWWCICLKILKIICYSENMKNDRDRTLQLEKWMGCAGQAWGMEQPLAAYISPDDHPGVGSPKWVLPPDVMELTKDVNVIVSVPIQNPNNAKIVGILNFDSQHLGAGYLLEPENFDKIKVLALSISQTLYKLEQF